MAGALDLGAARWFCVLRDEHGRLHAALLVSTPEGLRRAAPEDGAAHALLRLLVGGGRCGAFICHPVAAEIPPAGEQPVTTEQSNWSVVVGERVMLKLLLGVEPGPQPGDELPQHLHAVGFAATPTPVGSIRWDGSEAPTIVASATRYLPGASEGWEWFRDLLLGYLDGQVSAPEAIAPAATIGRLTADLHVALATPSDVLPDPVTTSTVRDARGWHSRAIATLAAALDATDGRRLAARSGRMRAVLEDMLQVTGTPLTRIHGDLHVGQVLRWRDGYAVADLEGHPLADADDRVGRHPPVRDVAAMARSLDHLGRVASRHRHGRHEEAVAAWIDAARTAYLTAHRDRLTEHKHTELFEPGLLRPFEVETASAEFVYAARYLPRWTYVPDQALRAMFPGATDGP